MFFDNVEYGDRQLPEIADRYNQLNSLLAAMPDLGESAQGRLAAAHRDRLWAVASTGNSFLAGSVVSLAVPAAVEDETIPLEDRAFIASPLVPETPLWGVALDFMTAANAARVLVHGIAELPVSGTVQDHVVPGDGALCYSQSGGARVLAVTGNGSRALIELGSSEKRYCGPFAVLPYPENKVRVNVVTGTLANTRSPRMMIVVNGRYRICDFSMATTRIFDRPTDADTVKFISAAVTRSSTNTSNGGFTVSFSDTLPDAATLNTTWGTVYAPLATVTKDEIIQLQCSPVVNTMMFCSYPESEIE